ncbi:MAG: hypothetical protein ACTSW4_01905 [Candidatus Ranarchaeia archaeon]
MVYLILKNRKFVETDEDDGTAEVSLFIDENNKKMTLKFSNECSFILRRTAERQARGIQKTGFLATGNHRVGENYELSIEGDQGVPERLTYSPRKVY